MQYWYRVQIIMRVKHQQNLEENLIRHRVHFSSTEGEEGTFNTFNTFKPSFPFLDSSLFSEQELKKGLRGQQKTGQETG